jgi:hypothetical protein
MRNICLYSGRSAVLLTLALASAVAAASDDWAKEMFDKTNFDFGSVARGAKVEHRFNLENIYLEDAHIAWVRASCGCTTPTITKQTLKTWEKSQVVATVDTRSFLGQKDVTITVYFDRPFPLETQLTIHCNIRGDVVLQPGVAQFGSLVQGVGGKCKVHVSYAGRNDWAISTIESPNPYLSAQATETRRGGGNVDYDVSIALRSDAPAGYLHEQLVLVTNESNPRAARVPIPIEGLVQSAITLHPSLLHFGTVEPGKSANRMLVVRGDVPFRIVTATSSDAKFQCTPPKNSATLHRLPVVFSGAATPGKFSAQVTVTTEPATTRPLGATLSIEVAAETEGAGGKADVAHEKDSKSAATNPRQAQIAKPE